MKKLPWPTVLLMLWPYAVHALTLLTIRLDLLLWLLGGLLTLMVTAVNIRCACRMQDAEVSALLGMCTKIAHIGAYVGTLFLCMVLFAAIPLVLGILLTNVCMLAATSAYTLRGVYLAWRGGKLTTGRALALAATQCIFVLDVPGSIALYAIEKRRSH